MKIVGALPDEDDDEMGPEETFYNMDPFFAPKPEDIDQETMDQLFGSRYAHRVMPGAWDEEA